MLDNKKKISTGNSHAETPVQAAADLVKAFGKKDFAAIFFFTAGVCDMAGLGKALSLHFPGVQVFGCSTAGVIGKGGYGRQGVSAFALPKGLFSVRAEIYNQISTIDMAKWSLQTKALVNGLNKDMGGAHKDNTFGLLLIDGLSMAEEAVLSAVYPELGEIALFGGSAGDDLKFDKTFIFYNGELHTNSAVLILIHTLCPIKVFRTEHFVETERKMVITEADPASRIVREINASPAAEEYARLIGVKVEDLNSTLFAAHPVMVRVAGSYYVRSIQRPEGEDGLRFFCAIDDGLVLTLAKGVDIVANLENAFDRLKQEMGQPQLIIGCDCIFRKLELEQDEAKFQQVSDLLDENNVYGFNTYGEQFAGMHVNQTFTGVAIGWSDENV